MEYRTLGNFERDKILPRDTIFYQQKVATQEARSRWHEQAVSALSEAGLIFLDQDNGFQVKSMTRKTQAKYALRQEAVDYCNLGKVVVAIQFASKVKPEVRVKKVRDELAEEVGRSVILPVVRGRVTPNILFFVIAPPRLVESARNALEMFEAKGPVLNGFKRIEMVN
jgi:hypothetical protein